MSKARLVKKEDIRPEMVQARRKGRGRKAPKPTRNTTQVATEWVNNQRTERPSARTAFEALFKGEPQSA